MKRIDLHIHTTASDGADSPEAVVRQAAELGLSAISVTDHDTVLGCEPAAAEAKKRGIELIPGIELSTRYNGPVHILGYFIDTSSPEIKALFDEIVADRDGRNEKAVALLRKDGIDITYEQMKDRFGEVVGWPHFATILIENGLAESTDDAFSRLIGKGMKYWVPRSTIPIERCVDVILSAGGIPVLAHPFEYKYQNKTLPELIELCINLGVRGIECRHSSHSPGQMAYLERLAEEYGLLKTGGSDYHGSVKPEVALGTGTGLVSVPQAWLEALREEHLAGASGLK